MALLLRVQYVFDSMCSQIFIHAFCHFPWPGGWGRWPWSPGRPAIFHTPEISYIIHRNCYTSQGDADSSFPLWPGHQVGKNTHFWEINISAKTAEFICVQNLWICTVNEEILKNVINIRTRFSISVDAVASKWWTLK